MRRVRTPPLFWSCVLAIALLALGLRVWGIGQGLPFPASGDEDGHFVGVGLRLSVHDLDPGYFVNPPALSYLLHAVYVVAFGADAALRRDADATAVFVVSRLVVAATGVAAVVLVALAGRRLGSPRAGVLAALTMAVAVIPTAYSRVAVNDVPAMAAAALALWLTARCLRDVRPGRAALAGAAVGLAATTKYTAGVAAVPLLVVLLEAGLAVGRRGTTLLGAGAASLAGIVVFFALDPYALVHHAEFVDALRMQEALSNATKLGTPGGDGRLFYLGTFGWSMGWVACAAILAGAVRLAARDRLALAVLLVGPVLFVLYMGGHTRFFPRWVLPIVPAGAVLAGTGADLAAGTLVRLARPRSAPLARAAVVAVAVALVLQPLIGVVGQARVLSRASSFAFAHDVLVRSVPPGQRVAFDPLLPAGFTSRSGSGRRPGWPTWLQAHPLRDADLVDVYAGSLNPLRVVQYVNEGTCWVISSESTYGRVLATPEAYPLAAKYYEAVARAARGRTSVATPYRSSTAGPGFGQRLVGAPPGRAQLYYDDAYARPGQGVVVSHLRGGRCG